MSGRSKYRMLSAVREASRQMPSPWPGAFFLTDPNRVSDPIAPTETLPAGTGVIYRHFGASDKVETGRALRHACNKRGIPLLIANDPMLAKHIKADGVHWPEARASEARKWQGQFLFQTQSAHSPRALREAVCEAVLYSAIFPSNSPSAGPALGPIKFRTLCHQSNALIYGLGGINGNTASAISNASGLAGIEGFL
ncbi:thiamine phosphate synthase [Ponticaulis sp.]|uniref:thiamine phosphate synthase n=1 Tax=Ponticaulis sp. TaxID=2020902 RepID=UPI0025DBF430|nr:thiamine phosphate synthase [Ponticaulis sp.]